LNRHPFALILQALLRQLNDGSNVDLMFVVKENPDMAQVSH
jgi:hypothetical protein